MAQLMNEVKLKKQDLLDTLRINLLKHRKDVEEALELRRTDIGREFDAVRSRMLASLTYQPKESFHFPLPVDCSSDYDKAIRMVEMTQEEFIFLDENQFDRLVMDNWQWKENLMRTSALYGKSM